MCTIRRPVIAHFYGKIAKLSNYKKQLSCSQKSYLTFGWYMNPVMLGSDVANIEIH